MRIFLSPANPELRSLNPRFLATAVLLIAFVLSGSLSVELLGQKGSRTRTPQRGVNSLLPVANGTAGVLFASPVQTIQTSLWLPPSPDPSGIAYDIVNDRLIIVDSEVNETVLYSGVNIWTSTRLGEETPSGTTFAWGGVLSDEPTGASYDPATGTLFVSSDDDSRVYVVRAGADGVFGTQDDLVRMIFTEFLFGLTDTEDPAFDPASGDLFVLDGVGGDVYRIDPVNGVFGDGDDTASSWAIGNLVTDAEGLAIHPARNTVLVGERNGNRILEFDKNGTLIQTIDMSGINGLDSISGLTVAPASNNSGQWNLWIVDRKVDNDSNPSENDGTIYEVSVPWGVNLPPVVDLVKIDNTSPGTNDVLTANVLAHDEEGDAISLSYQWYKNGVAIGGANSPTLDLSISGNGDKGDEITVEVIGSDGTNLSTSLTSQPVKILNTLPAVAYPNLESSEGETVNVSVAVTDPDGDTLTYAATGLPPGLTLNPTTGQITGTIDLGADDNSPYNVNITVSDGDTSAMPITLVQTATNVAGETSVTAIFSTPPTEGNLLVALGRIGSGRFPVMDPSWRFVILTNSTPRAVAYYKIAGPNESLAATLTAEDGGPTTIGLGLFEYSGVEMDEAEALDAWFARGQIPSTTTATAGPVFATETGSLLLAAIHTASNRDLGLWSNGFEHVGSFPSNLATTIHFADRLANAPGSFQTSNSWGDNPTNAATTLMSFVPKTPNAGQVQDGFVWVVNQLVPTAAPVSVSGRVVSANGRGISFALVKAQDANGTSWFARTNTFGYYRLTGLTAGDSYVLTASARSYSFAPLFVSPGQDIAGVIFTPNP